jgi:ketosteroid isomerase-like protein
MKIRLVVALVGLAISFALPAFAQQKEPSLSEQDREQILAIGKKNDDAWSKSDAAALAALFTEDAVFVTPGGDALGQRRYKNVIRTFSTTWKSG